MAKDKDDWQDVPLDDWQDAPVKKEDSGFSPSTALRGYGDAMTLGYRDNLQAATEPVVNAIGNFFTGNDVQSDGDYVQRRDAINKETEQMKNENPGSYYTGLGVGAVNTAVFPMLGAAKGATGLARIGNAAKTGALLGAATNPGEKEGEFSGLQADDRLKQMLFGGILGGGGQALGEGVTIAAKTTPEFLKKVAEKFAVNSTGATGKQASTFEQNAGRELLDRGLVKFGDTAENIATRTGKAVDEASTQIDEALKALDAQGVEVSADNVVSKLQEKISSLEKDPSQAGLVRKLKGVIDDIIETGESNVPISVAEKTKRGFRKAAGNWQDPEAGQAGKQAYLSYMDEVEGAANKANPELANKFTEGKDSFKLLRPIEEAAERRASTQNQSPWGGLSDVASLGAGGILGQSFDDGGGWKGALTGLALKRGVLPRLSSSTAVATDVFAKKLASMSPKFLEMSQKNPIAFKTMVQRLAQNPKFQSDPNAKKPSLPFYKLDSEPIMDRLGKDPKGMDFLQNDRLKEQLKKKQQQQNINKPVSEKQAQASFVENN